MKPVLRFSLLAVLISVSLVAQEGYRLPSPALIDIVDAPLLPEVSLAPARDRVLLLERAPAPAIAELAEPELRLAGIRFNPGSHASNRALTFTRLGFKTIVDGRETAVTGLPQGAKLANISWSPDGKHVAVVVFTGSSPGALWLVEVATARARALTGPRLNGVLGSPVDWLGGSALLARLIPADRGPLPVRRMSDLAPITQQTSGEKAAAPTYQDLLKNTQDEAEFEHYATGELVRVALDGTATPLGIRGLFNAEPSPDARYVLVTALHKPFSYQVPLGRFPTRLAVHDSSGKLVRELANLPLAENIPVATGSTRTGPRNVHWRADAPATLAWLEARDGGDGGQPAETRDELMLLAAPFVGSPAGLVKLGYRGTTVNWGDAQRAFVTESWVKTRRTRTWLFDPARPGAAPRLVFDRSSENRYTAPGLPVTHRGEFGRPVVLFSADGSSIYLRGEGASPEGDKPFLDQLALADLKTRRLWQSAAPDFEQFVAFLDDAGQRALTQRESVAKPPNYFVRDLAAGTSVAFTAFPNPFPQFAKVRKEIIAYPRADGVTLTGTLYLPPDWTPEKGRLPTLLWAYPREFKTAEAAAQVRDSPYRFVRVLPTGPLPFLLRGYAVLDDPAMPIVGEGAREPNDTYVTQLVASAKAAIDELVRRGVTDPARVGVGGHSYGAFMTANLLAHSNLFRAGIARSGAYNRTLTPFGFQAEDRTFWQAPEIYGAMSPFNYADKIKDALLLIHGQADDNTGTYPIQSERFYSALKGHGATARYVQLPYEAHGYRARESLLHMLWESETWLDTYVKPQPTDRAK